MIEYYKAIYAGYLATIHYIFILSLHACTQLLKPTLSMSSVTERPRPNWAELPLNRTLIVQPLQQVNGISLAHRFLACKMKV